MTVSFQNGSFLGGTASATTHTVSGGITAADLYNTDYLDRKYDYKDQKESHEIAYSGRDAVVEENISKFTTYLENGEEDKAMAAYQELIEEMSTQTRYAQLIDENGNNSQLKSVARQLIEEEIGGDLAEYIDAKARDAAGVEAQKIRSWGNCDSTSKEDLLKETCNIDMEKGHNILADAGSFIVSPIVGAWNFIFNGGKKM